MCSFLNKESYDEILKDIIDSWPKWKIELCNELLLTSVNSKKIVRVK